MKSHNNSLFASLREREQGYPLTQNSKSRITRNLAINMGARAVIDQAEFDYSIQKAKDEKGNARLNFPLCDFKKITFPPAVDEANTTYIGSCLTGAKFPDKANLSKLNFQKADFSHAKLNGAELRHADLTGAKLNRAELRHTHLTGAKLNRAELR